jgi:protein tyrosine phosphatase (PTP) superfamily phosphohydrolase (DUF442 family)
MLIVAGVELNPRYSLKDEAGEVARLGIEYIHIPVQWSHPKRENLLAFYDAMTRRQERRVWVHCAANPTWRNFIAEILGNAG